jgi:hypothetical protein
MGYLTPRDYKKTIQADNLQQVIGNDPIILTDAEETAIEKATTLLVQKYIVGREFQATSAWDKTQVYQAFNRVYLDADTYDVSATYIAGAYIKFLPTGEKNYKVYKSIAGNAPGAFSPAAWTFLNYQYSIYNAAPPVAEFNYKSVYAVGNMVYWNGRVYTCLIPSTLVTQDVALQYYIYAAIPYGNIFPNDPINGLQHWGAGVVYNVPANTDITNTTYWASGDNRSKLIVWAIVALTLYYCHARIAPMNIPELRVEDYKEAIRMMKKDFAEGEATAINLQPIQPRSGGRVRYGGNVKNNNTY